MTGSADEAAAGNSGAAVPARLLHEGEEVIIAVKPSFWFVLLVSWPSVLAVLSLGFAAYVLGDAMNLGLGRQLVLMFCLTLVLGQLFVACVQWVGRLYVLTNVRILMVHGVLKARITHCPLNRIKHLTLSATPSERALSVGSLYFHAEGLDVRESAWIHMAQPREIHDLVQQAIDRFPH